MSACRHAGCRHDRLDEGIAERFANGHASAEEAEAAWVTARTATLAAAWCAARAAWYAVWTAERDAARYAAEAEDEDEALAAQADKLRKVCLDVPAPTAKRGGLA